MIPSLATPGLHVLQADTEAKARERAESLIERLGGGSIVHVEQRVTAMRRAGKRSPDPNAWRTKSSTWIVYVQEARHDE